MQGLKKIAKLYGSININGIVWVWDYANDKPIKKSEMTEEMIAASERAKYTKKPCQS